MMGAGMGMEEAVELLKQDMLGNDVLGCGAEAKRAGLKGFCDTERKMKIFTSHLDQDTYKYSMGNIFWDKFRGTPAEYAYRCRDKSIDLRPIYKKLCEQIEAMQDVTLQKDEQKWLFENSRVTQDYLINFLSKFRFKPEQLKIQKIIDNPGLSIRPTGPIEEASLWEMPIMYIISELYFRNLYGKDFQKIINQAKSDLIEKINSTQKMLDKDPEINFLFSEFGTRRRLCHEFQDFAIKTLKERMPGNLVGTSNMMFARKHGIKAVGTVAHEFYELYQAFYHLLDSQKQALRDFITFYRGWLGISLTDTLGSNQWDRDFDKKMMIEYTGQRHDSGDPFEWADRRIAAYKREGIDPLEKKFLFSDNLTFTKALALSTHYQKKIGEVSHGIGTFITNNIPSTPSHKALNQVIKIVWVNGRPVAKTSDDFTKSQCEDVVYMDYVRHCVK